MKNPNLGPVAVKLTAAMSMRCCRSDLVIFCVQRQSGGAYRTLQYARKTGKQYLSIGSSIPPCG